MQIINLNTNLPQKKEEEFLKIDFASLFNFDFKEQKILDFSKLSLELKEQKDSFVYESKLFSIANKIDDKQKVLTIKENTKEPILIVNSIKEDDTLFSNNLLIEVLDGVKASVIEVFISNKNSSCLLSNRVIKANQNSSIEYVKIQDIKENNSFILSFKTIQEDSSNVEISNFELGNGFVVNSFENCIESLGVNYELNGLNKLRNSANISTLVNTTHNNQNSRSNINYKNSLLDNSRAVVKIKSKVTQKGLYSKAFQNCNSILLSDDAVIFAQPFLEIYIDELEASHGTTTGTLNKDELYYLTARGIPRNDAYLMLLEAFESSIKDNLKDENLKKFVEEYKKESYI
ncbi:SufD family Fe-S cluster assembly protein [Arcobacter vandammei]|uniref:SufD family Fe-S cluster assembly protein n=1 Tax=Arcobacter vandammei TaxID=2782243 RepID=UPI0018DF95AE|nr:SufD family Fe-S cluster assembly protein [Arcobacter vandammei]